MKYIIFSCRSAIKKRHARNLLNSLHNKMSINVALSNNDMIQIIIQYNHCFSPIYGKVALKLTDKY